MKLSIVCAFLTTSMASAVSAAPADKPIRPKILGVAHIALFVHDIEKSRPFTKISWATVNPSSWIIRTEAFR